jgi:hypothetical protein
VGYRAVRDLLSSNLSIDAGIPANLYRLAHLRLSSSSANNRQVPEIRPSSVRSLHRLNGLRIRSPAGEATFELDTCKSRDVP